MKRDRSYSTLTNIQKLDEPDLQKIRGGVRPQNLATDRDLGLKPDYTALVETNAVIDAMKSLWMP